MVPLSRIIGRELPVFLLIVDPLQEAAFLFCLRDMEEELQDKHAIANEVFSKFRMSWYRCCQISFLPATAEAFGGRAIPGAP